MSAPVAGIHPTAVIGQPPEMRKNRGEEAYKGGINHTPFRADMRMVAIEPTALIEALCTVDAGLEHPTYIGQRSWLMKRVHVGHDCYIDADCELAPGTTLGGYVRLGRGVHMGLGSVCRPKVSIGALAQVGAGAVVVCDIPPGEVWVGNPAHKLR